MMKKVVLAIISLLASHIQADAQKYLNIYQDGIVVKKILATEVDSISITETEPYTISMWAGGSIIQNYASEDVDSIKVTDEKGDPLSYLGIIGFNSELYTKEIGLFTQSSTSQFVSFVNSLPKKDGTILYYAVDSALNMLEESNIKTQLSSINFVTFTDGLDQGSIMLNPDFTSSNSYLQAVSKRIQETNIYDLKVNAYTIGLRGQDVSDIEMFNRNLVNLASSEQNAFEVKNIGELRSRLQDIANRIISVNTRQIVSVKIPGIDNGTLVRFTFDGKNAEDSQLYIEGKLNLSDYSLRDVSYHGIKALSGSYVQGTQDGIFLTFTFTGMRRNDSEGLLPTNNIKHYYRLPNSTIWQINSEFTPTNNTQRIVYYSGTCIVLILDCSSSLGSDFAKMKEYAIEFINMVASNTMPFKFLPPQNVHAAIDDTDLTVTVAWEASRNASHYQVYRSSNNSNYKLIADSVVSTSWKDMSPMTGKNYYKVSAVGVGLTTELSNSSNVVNCSLETPQNLRGEMVLDGDNLAIQVMWDSVKYAKHYKVYRSIKGNSSSSYVLVADSVLGNCWKDFSPTTGSNYYKVCAVCRELVSAQSVFCEAKYFMETPRNIKAVLDSIDLAVHVTWDEVPFAQRYKIFRRKMDTYDYEILTDTITNISWRDNFPIEGNNIYKVSAEGYGLVSNSSESSNSINCRIEAPQNVRADLDSVEYVIHISWDAVKYAEYYQIYRSSNNSNYMLIADSVVSTSWKDMSPLPNSNYYKIYAVGHGFTSSASSYKQVYCSLEKPQNVRGQLVRNGDKLAVQVKWDSVMHAEGYKVYRSSRSSNSFEMIADSVAPSSYLDTSPLSGNNYYKIRAIGHGMTSVESNTSQVINNSMPVPTNVTGELILYNNSLAVSVTWDAVEFAEKYRIYRSNSNRGTFSLIADDVTNNSCIDMSPLYGSNYYKVTAVGYGLTSNESIVSAVVNCSLAAPTAVTGELALKDNSLVVNVSWSSVKFAESYSVYRSNSSNGTYSKVAENVVDSLWTDESPIVGSNYYKVQASGYGLTSSYSNPSGVVNCSLSAPTNVIGELVANGNSLAINISWTAVTFAECYNIYRCNSKNGTYNLLAENITNTAWKDISPLNGNNYYKVCAIGHGLTSPLSAPSNLVNYIMSSPANVKGELVVNGNNLAIQVTWDSVSFAESYDVYRNSQRTGTFTLVAENVTSNSWLDEIPLQGNNFYQICAKGFGLTSSKSSVSAAVNYALNAPTNVKGELTLSDNKLVTSITWDEVQFAESYSVYRSQSKNGTYTLLAEGITSNAWRDDSPLDGSNYYKVSASGYGLTSQLSNASNVVNK